MDILASHTVMNSEQFVTLRRVSGAMNPAFASIAWALMVLPRTAPAEAAEGLLSSLRPRP